MKVGVLEPQYFLVLFLFWKPAFARIENEERIKDTERVGSNENEEAYSVHSTLVTE